MKKNLFFMLITTLLVSCGSSENDNPFFSANTNRYGVPDFEKIKIEHYVPAFKKGIEKQEKEIDSIANNPNSPTFSNTIEALEFSGEMLKRVSSVFYNLHSANTNESMDEIASEMSPILSEHNDNIYLNDKLFQRVKTIYEEKSKLSLTSEQVRLLDNYYRDFIRSGAALDEAQKAELREINKALSLAQLQFGENVLAETNDFQKFVTDTAMLSGLPEANIQAAAEEAKVVGREGEWLFTTQKMSFIPVLQYAVNRGLRKELLMAYTTRANHDNDHDNKALIDKIIKLRVKKAHLLGFETPAAFILDDTMAKTPEAVMTFLEKVWKPSVARAKREVAELQRMMDAEGKGEKLEPWDWWYYTEKVRQEKYDLDEAQLKPYFKLENVRKGVFGLATKLFGLKFEKLDDMPIYHPDVEVFKVVDKEESLVGILYTDYFPRAGKRAGAWMNNITEQYIKDSVNHRPIIVNVGNFTKPTADRPSLLTMDEVETLFHEFGHALHGLLAQSTYPSLSGTNVSRDFVEFPSQVMEYWCYEPEVMKTYAFHYKTGELMPESLMKKIANAGTFNQGFVMTELLSAALLDMNYHLKSDTTTISPNEFENDVMDKIGMIPEIIVRYRSPFYNHIFTGGYAAGYYSYTWSEVLAADAFDAFKSSGDVFNPELAQKYRDIVLARGNSYDPMESYKIFRGQDPTPDALLKRRGLK